ncbi:MAG TPA: Hsp20/alpha crystallin family protein [Candidatus Competibacteraceae bacterium]|nr:Hsp20/alpha crystallin family protein [Candidatus Competibacteraceae bacterium]
MAQDTPSEKQETVPVEKKGQDIQVQRAAPARALSPIEDIERMFDNFFRRGFLRPFHWDWPSWSELAAPLEEKLPRVDVIDRDEAVVVRAEVPGVDKDNLEVTLSDNTITIKGSTSHEEKEEKGNYYRCEISQGSFARTVALPADVDGSKAKASFKDGLLEVTLPKVTPAQRHTIKVE